MAAASGLASAARALRRWADAAIAAGLYAVAAAVGLASVAAVNAQGLLSGEEVSVSLLDVVAVPGRFQPTVYATNFAGHVQFWLFSHLDPSFDLFYGRTWKALAMALVAPLVHATLRRRLGCGRGPAALGALAAVLLPGVGAVAWLATENGLEVVWGLAALLLATSQRRVWVLAPVAAGVAVSSYGAGLAWAGAVGALVAVRLVRSPSRVRHLRAVLAASAAGLAVVLVPLVWWEGGGRIVLGGGSVGSADPVAALRSLGGELFVRGESYYYFTDAPALGSPWLAGVLAVAVVAGTALRPRLWPWTLALVLTVVLYALSGGVLGVRRAVAIPVLVALALAVVVDVLARRRAPLARLLLVTAAGVAVLGPLGGQYLDIRDGWRTGRYALPRDFDFPIAEGATMAEEVTALTGRLNSGAATYREIAAEREGERSLAMAWLLAVRRGGDLTGLATPEQIGDLVAESPRCTADCRPVPGRP
ncbi:hypothetical protein [Geodermatophilus ruber]|uniref:Dolichyl-phosphate-mannose-protein mannosyltransferase n=1 Tax=Geodermatophilus ruber TaxID=504800 RepID=A0A1I4I4B9_9ACTN|nr:hypothetical protein [Geodermatophilus ruber]SFL48947.1 hypothetical protein SAMN04488085_11222 [Geodermatophilus ruber]